MNDKSQFGFTLIEVLVAFVILAMTLTVILQITGQGSKNIRIAEEYQQARQLAENLVNELSMYISDENLLQQGNAGIFSWTISASVPSFRDQSGFNDQLGFETRLENLRYIDIKINWNTSGRERTFELKTARLLN